MNNLRKYGRPPYTVAVIHGGPGAAGYMAPVARELSKNFGVLEPLQTVDSLNGQVEELKSILMENAELPVTLIGSSWGAMLGYIFTARHPLLVEKLILIGSALYEPQYAEKVMETRYHRLNKTQQQKARKLRTALNNPANDHQDDTFSKLGELLSLADMKDPVTKESEILEHRYDIFQNVWDEAERLRSEGKFLEMGKKIKCPVVAIHGDYDALPYQGVKEPLSKVLKNFKFILLKNCGHYPWRERVVKDEFYELLKEELENPIV